jgi:hypothetical protein
MMTFTKENNNIRIKYVKFIFTNAPVNGVIFKNFWSLCGCGAKQWCSVVSEL